MKKKLPGSARLVKNNMKLIAGLFGLSVIVVALTLVFIDLPEENEELTVATSFEECVQLGFPVMESYPRQCRDDADNAFVEKIGNELELADMIRVSSPRPNAVIEHPLKITGEARGYWFFEADAPVQLVVGEQVIAEGYIQATDDWMTEDFVSFEGTLEYDFIHTKDVAGTLVLLQADPAGGEGGPKEKLEMPVIVVPTQVETVKKCVISGCSNQVCGDEEVATTCEFKEEYACYANATCEVQSTGECGWTETDELVQCVSDAQGE